MTYDNLIAELFPRLTGGVRWGLDRTLRMLADVGDPHRALRCIHIGGTNGKGSVAAHVECVLRASGLRTGLYTSPHLCTFRERICLEGAAITADALVAAAERLWPSVLREQPSFFEATTAIAFLAFAEAGVEAAVVEVGLGGRLDATNVITPVATVLTNVSLDHVQLLGDTLEAVAREKAGIIMPGVPVVTGERGSAAAEVFRAAADAAGAPLTTLSSSRLVDVSAGPGGTTFTLPATGWGDLRLHTPLAGQHQAMNAALAVLALDAAGPLRPGIDAVHAGLRDVLWPGRLQRLQRDGVTWLLDVAHNVAGVQTLVDALPTLDLPRPWTALVGVLGDKDWPGMLRPLRSAVNHMLLTEPPTAPVERRWNVTDAAAAVEGAADVERDFRAAVARAEARGGTVIVTGSFHTVGDALALLGACADGVDADMNVLLGVR